MFCMKAPVVLPSVVAFAGLAASLSVGLSAGSVWAQAAPAPDAPVSQPQAATAQSDAVDAQIAAWTQTPDAADSDPSKAGIVEIVPRQIHGEAGVAFGSNGYRSGYITTDIPLGKNSDLGITVGESQIKPKHFGTVTDKSLAISLNIGGGNFGPSVNCGSPTAAMDGRYLEPAWISRRNGEALARDQIGCEGSPTVVSPRAAP